MRPSYWYGLVVLVLLLTACEGGPSSGVQTAAVETVEAAMTRSSRQRPPNLLQLPPQVPRRPRALHPRLPPFRAPPACLIRWNMAGRRS